MKYSLLLLFAALLSFSACNTDDISLDAEGPSGDCVDCVSVMRSSGMQCKPLELNSVQEARAQLENDGIGVAEIGEKNNIAVCEACGICPSLPFYEAIIDRKDFAKAENLGWQESTD